MIKLTLVFFVLALCSSGKASSSSPDEHPLHRELKKLRQLSRDIDVQLPSPSRAPALPKSDEVSLRQSAPQRPRGTPKENKKSQKRKRTPGTPMYRGR